MKSTMKVVPYHRVSLELVDRFEDFYIDHVPRLESTDTDTLAIPLQHLQPH